MTKKDINKYLSLFSAFFIFSFFAAIVFIYMNYQNRLKNQLVKKMSQDYSETVNYINNIYNDTEQLLKKEVENPELQATIEKQIENVGNVVSFSNENIEWLNDRSNTKNEIIKKNIDDTKKFYLQTSNTLLIYNKRLEYANNVILTINLLNENLSKLNNIGLDNDDQDQIDNINNNESKTQPNNSSSVHEDDTVEKKMEKLRNKYISDSKKALQKIEPPNEFDTFHSSLLIDMENLSNNDSHTFVINKNDISLLIDFSNIDVIDDLYKDALDTKRMINELEAFYDLDTAKVDIESWSN